MIDLCEISNYIEKSPKGYWKSTVNENISYTENGHNLIEESEENSFWYDHRLNSLTEIIKHYPIKTIMDIGGGNGQISHFFQINDIESILLEPLIDGVINAQKKEIKHIIHGSFDSIKSNENSIPNIGLFDVLEHIEDDKKMIQQLYKSLKSNGYLFISVPALQLLFSNFDKEVGHYRRYTLSNLKYKLKECGFEVKFNSYLFFPLPFIIFPIRKFYHLIRKRKKRRKLGHINKNGYLGKLMKFYLDFEIFLIKQKIKIPFGSTCIIIAYKP